MSIKKNMLFAFARSIPKDLRANFFKDVIGGSLCGLHIGTFIPFFALISRDIFKANEFLIGIMSVGLFIGSFFAMFYGSIVPLNKEMKYYIWITYLGRALILILALAQTDYVYCLMIFSLNFVLALASPQYSIIVQRIYPIRYRGALMGYVRLCVALCSLVATLIAGAVMKDGEHWRIFFFMSGVFALLSTFAFSLVKVPDAKVLAEKRESTFKYILSSFLLLKENARNNRLLISVTFFSIGQLILATLLPIFQVDRLNMNTQDVAVLLIVQNIIWMIGFPFWGRYIDKHNPIKAWVLTCILAAVLPINYLFATNWTHVIFGHAVNGFFAAGSELAWFNAVLLLSKPGKEGKYQSLHAFFTGIRGTIGVFGGALFIRFFNDINVDIKYIFIISGVLVAGSVLFLLGMMNNAKPED